MKAILISPRINLIEVVSQYLSPNGRDYSSNLVIFPGKRPAYFLRKFIAKKIKASFIPPRIFSMDEFIDYLYEEELGQRKRKLEPIDAVAILYEIHKNSVHSLGENSFFEPDTFFPLGLKIWSDLEELYIENVSPDQLRATDHITHENIPAPTAQKLQSLSYFYQSFYQRIIEDSYSTRSLRYQEVALKIDQVNLDHFCKIILAGFFAFTRSEKKIFNFLKTKEQVVCIFQEGWGLNLEEIGIHPEKELRPGKPTLYFYQSPDTHGQVLGVGNILKEKIAQGEKLDENTVIVLPAAETLFPLYHHTLNFLNSEQYNISLGYPLLRTPLFSLFNNLMNLITSREEDCLYVPYYLEFVLHPYIKNIYFDNQTEITRVLFHTVEEVLRERRTKRFMNLSEIEQDEQIITLVREKIRKLAPEVSPEEIITHLKSIHEHTIKKILASKNVGDFATQLKEVVEYIYRKSTARLHPFFYPYSESFLTELDLISRSLMREIKFEEVGTYFKLVKKVLASTYIPFTGTPIRGIQVLGMLETRNLKFDKVFFLDLNEGIIPEIKKEETLLPFKVRKILGLPTYFDRERLMGYYFDILIQGAQEAHLFYIENSEKERSRFIERLIWERQKEEKRMDDQTYIKKIQYQVTLQEKRPLPINKTEEIVRFLKDFSFSASSLDTYLNCPLKFYYKYVLGLTEKEGVSEELEQEEIGLLVHQVLFDYFRGKIGQILTPKSLNLCELEKIIDYRFEEQYGKEVVGEIYLLKRQVKKHLEDFIKQYQIPKLKDTPVKIINLEHQLETTKDIFRLTARMDRIENRGNRIAIIDYKTSANRKYLSINFNKLDLNKRESWNEAIATLQLPFYNIVYSLSTGVSPEEIECFFLLLGRNLIDQDIELPLFEDKDRNGLAEKLSSLHHIIFTLLKEIIDPNQPFIPASNRQDQCRWCIYNNTCSNS